LRFAYGAESGYNGFWPHNGSREVGEKIHYAWVVLSLSVVVVFVSHGLARFGYSLLLPSMQASLGLSNTETGGLATANMVGYLLFSLVGGTLASRFGARIVICLGMILSVVGMALTATVSQLWPAAFYRGIAGMGSGLSNIPVMGLVSLWFGHRMRGLATGVAVSGTSFAFIILGVLVPRFLATRGPSGWRHIWYIYAAVAVVFTILTALFLSDAPEKRGLDAVGGGGHASDSSIGTGKLAWGRVYKTPVVWFLGLLYTAFGYSYIVYVTFFVRYLSGELGYSQVAAGNLFMIIGWCSLGCGLLWSGLSDRIGRLPTLGFVYLMQAISYALFAFAASRAGVLASVVFFGLTAWSIPAIIAASCGDYVGRRLAPAALGFVTLFFGVGQALGPTVAGMIADSSASLKGAYVLNTCVVIAGAAGSFVLWRRYPQAQGGEASA
jgi:MFS family permease